MTQVRRPYELTIQELGVHLDEMVDTVFGDLTSQFQVLPKGQAFVSYSAFRDGYEALRMATGGFSNVTPEHCWEALKTDARALLALRTILGFSPPEWQDLAKENTGEVFTSNYARSLEGKAKRDSGFFAARRRHLSLDDKRVTALLTTACRLLNEPVISTPEDFLHRLDKFDTQDAPASLRHAAQGHVPYAVLLYERYLGRPFASHRDAVSELVGDVMESAIEQRLTAALVPFRKTRRAERVPGYEQAPDFFVPDEISPAVIIEAKVTGDDGTARDKVARLLRLAHMRDLREVEGRPPWQLVACIDGRGFGVRRQDVRDLLAATHGKVFTLNTLRDLIEWTDLVRFAPSNAS